MNIRILSQVSLVGTFAKLIVDMAPSPLTVMTFNLRMMGADSGPNRWEAREPRIHATIQAADPDILGVQEAHYPQYQSIQRCLPNHVAIGVGRGDGDKADEFAAIFLRKSRFQVLASDTFWLSETPELPGSMSWETACTRICTWAEVREQAGSNLLIANTHWDHISTRAQEGGAELIANLIQSRAADQGILVMGDLNSTDEDVSVQTLAREGNLASVLPNQARGTYHEFTGEPMGRPIDHIFYRNLNLRSVMVKEDSFDGLYPSDHFPIVASFVA